MKIYQYNEPLYADGCYEVVGNKLIEKTEQEILAEYWPIWKCCMDKKYGSGHISTSEQNCIEDWCSTNWAWEKINNKE